MSEHRARIRWRRQDGERFVDQKYSRAHHWEFDGGLTVAASSSPGAVPVPYSKPENVDPEEAFVASLCSCHMLTFMWLAAREKFVVDAYEDIAIGHLSRNDRHRMAVTSVRLTPKVVFSGEKLPTDADVERLHHEAHEQCFIANSVLSEIAVEGSWSCA